jgi:hypothetical protein
MNLLPFLIAALPGIFDRRPPAQRGAVYVKRHGRKIWNEAAHIAPKQIVRNFNGMSAFKQFKPFHPGHTGR